MKFDRLGDLTSELSTSLVKSLVLPAGFLEWLSKPLSERLRDKLKVTAGPRAADAEYAHRPVSPAGPLVLFGGNPVPDEAIVAIIHLVGGRSARMAVIPAASADPEKTAEESVRLFTRFGMRGVEVLPITTRERADDPTEAARLMEFQAVLVAGPDPLHGLEVLRDTACAHALQAINVAGKLVAGLGGGAALLAEKLLVLREGREELIDGLGLASGLAVETAAQQARFGRLAKALGNGSPGSLMGVDIDSGTALVICDGEAKVLGESTVTFLDSKETADSGSASNSALCGLKVHVLTAGYGINLRNRKPITPVKEPVQTASEG